VGALEHVIIGRNDQPALQRPRALPLVDVIGLLEAVHIGDFKVVRTVLDFLPAENIAVGEPDAGQPVNIPDLILILQGQGDALQPVSDLHRDRLQGDPAGLLKVRELGDLLAIQPDLPAQPPCAQRRGFPVVLHEADIVLAGGDAQRGQRLQVQLLRVAGIGLEDDLVLVKVLHAVGILAVAAIIRADGRLHVGDVPRLRAEDAQQRGRVAGARADLDVVRLPQHTALVGPEPVELHDHILKGKRCHA